MILLGIFFSCYYQKQFTFNINKTTGEKKNLIVFIKIKSLEHKLKQQMVNI